MQHGAAVELLSRSPLFHGLGEEFLASIVRRCDIRPFGAGQVLSLAESPAESAFLVIEGEIALHDADGKSAGITRGPGTLLDEAAMFIPTDHFLGAVALDNGAILELPRYVISRLIVERPHLARHFARSTKQNLTRMAETLRELDQMLAESAIGLDSLSDLRDPGVSIEQEAMTGEGDLPSLMGPFGPRDALGDLVTRAAASSQAGDFDAGHDGEMSSAGSSQKATDLIAQLNAAISQTAQSPQQQAHDRMAYPNRVLPQSPGETRLTSSIRDLSRRDPAAGPDSTGASPARGSSTT